MNSFNIIYSVIIVLNICFFIPGIWKLENPSSYNNDNEKIVYSVACFIPIVNGIVLVLSVAFYAIFLFENREEKQKFKKIPEYNSLCTLKKIHTIYHSEVCYLGDNKNFNILTNFVSRFDILIGLLEQNFQEPKISQLLLKYELTFVRMFGIIEESKKVNRNMLPELLLVSKDTLELFRDEVREIRQREKDLKMEMEEATRKRFIDELLTDQELHKKNTLGNVSI